jgi:hypothetical protein
VSLIRRPGARFNRGRINAPNEHIGTTGGVTSAPVFIFTASEVLSIPQTTTAVANVDTNVTKTARPIATDMVNGHMYMGTYRNSDLQIVIAKQTGGTGAFVETVATSTIVDVSDNHCSLKLIVDDTGRLNVWLGSHSNQEKYWVAPSPGDALITDATLISPRVAGGAALEAQATYHDPVRLNDGAIGVTWRSGVSGNGDQYFDVKRAGTWVRKPRVLNGTSTGVDFYVDNLAIEEATSVHPNRIYMGFSCRPSQDPATAFGKWLIYSDDEGDHWRAWKTGAILPAGAQIADLTDALVEAIPDAYTDANYSFFFGNQGLCVGLDGVPTLTAYYGPATAPVGLPNGYGTPTGSLGIYAWRCNPATGTVVKQTLATCPGFGTTTLGVSISTPVWKGSQLACFYSKRLASDAAGVGRMYCAKADGDSLANPTELEVFSRNYVQDVRDTTFCFDMAAWAQGSGALKWLFMKASNSGLQASNAPAVATVTFSTTQPVIKDPTEIANQIYGANALDWRLRSDSRTLDVSNNVQTGIDLSGNTRNFGSASSSVRPSIVTVSGRDFWRFDGTDDQLILTGGLARPAPDATHQYYIWLVGANVTWTASDQIVNANGAVIYQSASGTNTRMNHGISGQSAAGMSLGTYRVVRALFTGSTSDTLQIDGGAVVTGTSSGTTISGTAVMIGGAAGFAWSNVDIGEVFALRLTAAPTAKFLYDIDGYQKLYWPALV